MWGGLWQGSWDEHIYIYIYMLLLYVPDQQIPSARHQFSAGDEVIVSLGNPLDKKAWKGRMWDVGAIISIYLFVCLSINESINLIIHPSIHPSIHLFIYLPTYLSIYLSICRSIDLSVYRSIDLSIYLSINLSIFRIYSRLNTMCCMLGIWLFIDMRSSPRP